MQQHPGSQRVTIVCCVHQSRPAIHTGNIHAYARSKLPADFVHVARSGSIPQTPPPGLHVALPFAQARSIAGIVEQRDDGVVPLLLRQCPRSIAMFIGNIDIRPGGNERGRNSVEPFQRLLQFPFRVVKNPSFCNAFEHFGFAVAGNIHQRGFAIVIHNIDIRPGGNEQVDDIGMS